MIRTWMADITSLLSEEQYLEYYHTVPAWRKEKADRLNFQADKALSVGAWILFQKMCKEYELGEEVPFNLSHSGTYVLCSVEDSGDASVKVGCDLEEVKEDRLEVAKRFFCEEEYQSVLERKQDFYRLWVLKESFMKATRLGMKLGMNEFEIGFAESGKPLLKSKPEKIDGQYYFREYEWGELPYRIAVCANRNDFAKALHVVNL